MNIANVTLTIACWLLCGCAYALAAPLPGPIPPEPGVEHSREVWLEYERDLARAELAEFKDKTEFNSNFRKCVYLGVTVVGVLIVTGLAVAEWRSLRAN